MMRRTRNDTPTRERIAAYWFPKHFARFGKTRTGDDELLADECWACGNGTRVERCHIHSFDDGGPNTADNLVLLCRPCHDESEFLSPDGFWTWIRSKRQVDWMSAAERARKKLRLVCGGEDRLAQRIEEVGAKAAIDEVFAALGFSHRYEDMMQLYTKGKKEPTQ